MQGVCKGASGQRASGHLGQAWAPCRQASVHMKRCKAGMVVGVRGHAGGTT